MFGGEGWAYGKYSLFYTHTRLTQGEIPEHHLYILVSTYLRSHPSTPHTPLRLRIQGMPAPEGPVEPPAVPLGWKMGTVLPLHSPALSGGGISENILRDMMQGV